MKDGGWRYNKSFVYCCGLAPGTVSSISDWALGDDSKQNSHNSWLIAIHSLCLSLMISDFKENLTLNKPPLVLQFVFNHYLILVMRKPAFCICENKDADQLRGNREADQRLCFRHIDSTIPLLSKYEISSL